jgi:hypothetical protein
MIINENNNYPPNYIRGVRKFPADLVAGTRYYMEYHGGMGPLLIIEFREIYYLNGRNVIEFNEIAEFCDENWEPTDVPRYHQEDMFGNINADLVKFYEIV